MCPAAFPPVDLALLRPRFEKGLLLWRPGAVHEHDVSRTATGSAVSTRGAPATVTRRHTGTASQGGAGKPVILRRLGMATHPLRAYRLSVGFRAHGCCP